MTLQGTLDRYEEYLRLQGEIGKLLGKVTVGGPGLGDEANGSE